MRRLVGVLLAILVGPILCIGCVQVPQPVTQDPVRPAWTKAAALARRAIVVKAIAEGIKQKSPTKAAPMLAGPMLEIWMANFNLSKRFREVPSVYGIGQGTIVDMSVPPAGPYPRTAALIVQPTVKKLSKLRAVEIWTRESAVTEWILTLSVELQATALPPLAALRAGVSPALPKRLGSMDLSSGTEIARAYDHPTAKSQRLLVPTPALTILERADKAEAKRTRKWARVSRSVYATGSAHSVAARDGALMVVAVRYRQFLDAIEGHTIIFSGNVKRDLPDEYTKTIDEYILQVLVHVPSKGKARAIEYTGYVVDKVGV